MKYKLGKTLVLYSALTVASIVFLHAKMGLADNALVPVPDTKPIVKSVSAPNAPHPSTKPKYGVKSNLVQGSRYQQSESKSTVKPREKPIKSAKLQLNDGDIPLPQKRPRNLKPTAHKAVMTEHVTVDVSRPVLASLSRSDAKLYETIFKHQTLGQMNAADVNIAKLKNGLLLGHVKAQRYLHPLTNTTFDDLQGWLDAYSDHPQAKKIHDLATRKGSGNLKKPLSAPHIAGALGSVSKSGKKYKSSKQRSATQRAAIQDVYKAIRSHVQANEPTQAYNLLNNSDAKAYMDTVEYDRALAMISAGYLYSGKLDQANKHASAALERSGAYVPMAGWVKGLVQWQRENYKQSARAFEVAASSPYSSGWLISAAGYWASRSHMRSGNVRVVSHWLKLSASFPRTFYGLLATRALGMDYDFDWSSPDLNKDQRKAIEATAQGKRAKALIEVGQIAKAETELQLLYKRNDPAVRSALLAYAYEHKLPALTMRLGHATSKPGGGLYDVALYPLIPWEPKNGYVLDKALLHAFMRQESKFNTSAQSHSGATGLMQLMPSTASYIAGKKIYKEKAGIYQLRDPHTNLDIGQTYIKRLLNNKTVGQDLLSLTIAYNAGPGNLSRWKKQRKHIKDPLMFIETIPYAETRAFVERVLSNYWIYRLQMGQETPSLDAVAEGRWARYAAMDDGAKYAGK